MTPLLPLFAVILCVSAVGALAQPTNFPKPSRTVYKCEVQGKVVYSDDPCLGAQRIEVEPTRGLSKSTGKEQVGRDVAREVQHEQLAEALRPLSGLNARQLDVQAKRYPLSPADKLECLQLDSSIPQTEQQERKAAAADRPSVQYNLLLQRKRYRELHC